jgi:hypothetical protein
MNLEEWMKLGELGFIISQAIFLLVMFLLRSTFASKRDVAVAHARADGAHHRMDVLDERLKGFPGYDTTNEIKDDVVQLKEGQSSMETEIRLLRETVARLDDYLRHNR